MAVQADFNALPDAEQMVIAMEVWALPGSGLPANREREGVLNLHMEKGAINEQVTAAFYANGTARMRDIAVAWCEPCWALPGNGLLANHEREAWAKGEADRFDGCFDWEWIPLFLAECIDWTDPHRPVLKPDHDGIASNLTDEIRAPASEAAREASA